MKRRTLGMTMLATGVAGFLVTGIVSTVLGPNSASRIEERVQAAANAALADARLTTWSARASGQHVELEGVAPTVEARNEIIAALRNAGAGVGAEKVDVAPLASPFTWTARKENGRVFLEGVAPSRAAFESIHNAARKLYGGDMSSEMTLASGGPAGIQWDAAAIAGLEALVKLERGSAHLTGQRLTVSGLAPSDLDAETIAITLSHAKGGVTAVVDVLGPPEWVATNDHGRLILQGKVASEDAKRKLLKAAGGSDDAEDRSYVAETGAWQARAEEALPHLAKFKVGEITVQGRYFRIAGEATGSVIASLREDMARLEDDYRLDLKAVEVDPRMPELAGLDLRARGDDHADICQTALTRIGNSNQIEFASNRTAISQRSGGALDKLVAVARACSDLQIEIQGYTDSTGRRSVNVALSRERASAIKDYLVERGLSADRLTAVGYGSDRPAGSNRTESGRAKNRRIEYRVIRGETR
ncbi:MAG: OmpA family protein [Hyphomonadaceae bacterium]|nr:OmpA family protein [Hyphomonadaceae bacterium]